MYRSIQNVNVYKQNQTKRKEKRVIITALKPEKSKFWQASAMWKQSCMHNTGWSTIRMQYLIQALQIKLHDDKL